jgi:hypothetical protein
MKYETITKNEFMKEKNNILKNQGLKYDLSDSILTF